MRSTFSTSLATLTLVPFAALLLAARRDAAPTPIDVTVSEGTSMSVAASPDGRTLAIDLQGSIWTVPATGGTATRITDVFNDARQPAWSPDGRSIAFFAYRDGGYDLWAIAPDGSGQHKLTAGAFDDREPAWSHDGTRVAFSSDRGNPLGSDYNIWILDVRSGALRQLTKDPLDDYMPSWSPDDREIAFASTRDGGRSVWAVDVATGAERRVLSASGTVDAPSWGPGGSIVSHVVAPGHGRLEIDGQPVTADENAFPFRASWLSATEFVYVSDGRIRRRSVPGSGARLGGQAPLSRTGARLGGQAPMSGTIEFRATVQVTRPDYVRRKRDFDSTAPRPALGIVRPVISPDGASVVFAALGDIYVMPVGGKPSNITRDHALDTDPAWSPDGTQLVYSSDKDSEHLQLWIRDMPTGQSRRVTNLATQPQGATWSPDGKRIAFFNVTGMWRVAEMSVLDVPSGVVTNIHDTLPQPGTPTWSPDGTRIAFANIAPMSRRFREGTNQILTVAANLANPSNADRWFAPIPLLSIDSRGGCGPVWSPDGTKMAAIYEGVLAVWPVSAGGEPLGPPRRITSESAHAPTWAGDSRRILYQSLDKLKLVDVETGEINDVPLDLTYTLDVPKRRLLVHAGSLVDMKTSAARANVDILIDRNRIVSVEPHDAARHAGADVPWTGRT